MDLGQTEKQERNAKKLFTGFRNDGQATAGCLYAFAKSGGNDGIKWSTRDKGSFGPSFIRFRASLSRSAPRIVATTTDKLLSLSPYLVQLLTPFLLARSSWPAFHISVSVFVSKASHERGVLAKTSRLVNSKSAGTLRAFLHVYNLLPVLVVLEKLPDAGGKPGQMTSGVPFHYVENVKAQLSQWLYTLGVKGIPLFPFFCPFFPFSSSSFLFSLAAKDISRYHKAFFTSYRLLDRSFRHTQESLNDKNISDRISIRDLFRRKREKDYWKSL